MPTPAPRPAAPAPVQTQDIVVGTVLTVVSGDTERPVAGATVTVAGRSYTTDGAGEARLGEAVMRGALVDVVATGFLDRQTTIRSRDATRFSLWPETSTTGLDPHTTAELVYTPGASCCPADTLAGQPLRRVLPTIGRFTVVLDERYRGNGGVRAAIDEGASLAGRASGARVVFMPADTGAGPRIDITSGPDPANRPNIAAFADRQINAQGYITGGRVVFVIEDYLNGRRSPRDLAYIVTHELGHMLGLGHSSAPGVMSVFGGRANYGAFLDISRDFSPTEKLVLDLMYERRAGTRFPDNDRQAAATSEGRERIVCRF